MDRLDDDGLRTDIDEGADITDGSTQEIAAPDPSLIETVAPLGPVPPPGPATWCSPVSPLPSR